MVTLKKEFTFANDGFVSVELLDPGELIIPDGPAENDVDEVVVVGLRVDVKISVEDSARGITSPMYVVGGVGVGPAETIVVARGSKATNVMDSEVFIAKFIIAVIMISKDVEISSKLDLALLALEVYFYTLN